MSRTITIVSPSISGNGKRDINTNAGTWGELKTQIGREISGFSTSSIKGVVRGSNVELAMDSAVIPSDASIIFIFPEKTKSGYDADDVMEAISDLSDDINAIRELLEEKLSGFTTDFEKAKDSLLDEALQLRQKMEK